MGVKRKITIKKIYKKYICKLTIIALFRDKGFS